MATRRWWRRSAIERYLISCCWTSPNKQRVCMCLHVGVVRMRVSEGESRMVRNGTRRINPVIALKFKPRLYSISMGHHGVRKTDSPQPRTPNPPRNGSSRHPGMASDTWTSFQIAAIQKAQDGCSRSCVGRQVMRVAQSMILKLWKEKRGVHVWVAVVNLWVVGLGAASCS